MLRHWIYMLVLSPLAGFAQQIPFDLDQWNIQAQEAHIVNYLGQEALRLRGGMAQPKDIVMMDGTIEFDIAFPPIRSFSGIAFRAQDLQTYEHFYLRPHQSGFEDANQYTPQYNGVAGWQLYFGPEYSHAIDFSFDAWMHVKIVLKGQQAEFFVKDMNQPLLVSKRLKQMPIEGPLAFTASALGPAYFANLSVTKTSPGKMSYVNDGAAPDGYVKSWQVSSTFAEARLQKDEFKKIGKDVSWHSMASESSGVANLAQMNKLTQEKNTVFAKVAIDAEKTMTKDFQFGYSDRVRVFLNGVPLYQGDNGYRTRDYRYLGTIGLFDSVSLPLKAGANELVFAVSESFGGWGVMCKVADMSGIQFK